MIEIHIQTLSSSIKKTKSLIISTLKSGWIKRVNDQIKRLIQGLLFISRSRRRRSHLYHQELALVERSLKLNIQRGDSKVIK
jgi:hypothetical protein